MRDVHADVEITKISRTNVPESLGQYANIEILLTYQMIGKNETPHIEKLPVKIRKAYLL